MIGRLLLAAIILNLVVTLGCTKQSKDTAPSPPSEMPPRAAVTLKLLVVGDTELAEAVRLLRGEWAERSGGKLEVEEMEPADLSASDLPEADVIVYPTQYLAELVIEEKLRPIRRSVLEDSHFAFDDLLPAVRNEVMRYGGEVFAISLGEAPLMLIRPEDSVEMPNDEDFEDQTHNRVLTWKQISKTRSHPSYRPSAELIARAASSVDPQTRSELLFDPKDMSPRLNAPHFERALSQMSQPVIERGSTGYQIACPVGRALAGDESVYLSKLPTAEETFNEIRDRWEPRTPSSSLTVLGFSGRCASVTTSTRNATSAFKLLGWLGSGKPAMRLSSSSGETIFFRNSQRHQASKWLGQSGEAAAPIVVELLSTGEPFLLPRIPQIDGYLKLLDEALEQAGGGDGAAALLESVSDQWQQLTDELGREHQRRCYRLHLGLESFSE